jgi:hypothetical protein
MTAKSTRSTLQAKPTTKITAAPKLASPTKTLTAKAKALPKRKPAAVSPNVQAPKVLMPSVRSSTKQAQLIALLRSEAGGTIEQMMVLTGWQAHTVRGTISGVLRKRLGLDVQSAHALASGVRVYRIAESAAA